MGTGCSEDRHGRLGFDGSCKGFYSGWLGHVCKGFTSEHLVLEPREEGKKTVEVRSFCVGTHGAVAKKRRSGFGMAAWCHGQSIRAIQVSKNVPRIFVTQSPALTIAVGKVRTEDLAFKCQGGKSTFSGLVCSPLAALGCVFEAKCRGSNWFG